VGSPAFPFFVRALERFVFVFFGCDGFFFVLGFPNFEDSAGKLVATPTPKPE
jgi:hypothetical protein